MTGIETQNLESLQNVSVIIPSLDPDKRLAGVVEGLQKVGFCDIILIDDGSAEKNKVFFPKGEGITLITHEVNRGKGAALKTALKYILENRPNSLGAVTCDGDGQHLAADVRHVCLEMLKSGKYVLGVRDFSLEDVPKKSRIGNRTSSFALALVCGVKISDTQTGLRAIPSSLFEPMSLVDGDRFEYETNVLLELKSMNAEYSEVPIETVYLDENKGSHFRPFHDTLRICKIIFKYLFSSLAAFVTDILLFTLLSSGLKLGVIVCTIIARIFSSAVNFVLNKKVVFHSGAPVLRCAVKYYALAIPVMLLSAFGVKGIAYLLRLEQGSGVITFIKVIVDLILFIANFKIQQKWIFKKKSKPNKK